MENNVRKFTLDKEFAIIHWEDSWTHGNIQLSEAEWKKKNIGYAVSVGLIVNEDRKQISLATDYFYPQSVDLDGSFRVVNSFPKSSIHKIIRIELPVEIKKQISKHYTNPKEKSKEEPGTAKSA